MFQSAKRLIPVAIVAAAIAASASAGGTAKDERTDNGIVHVRSAYSVAETVHRLQQDIAAKGIMSFTTIDQARLAADVGVPP